MGVRAAASPGPGWPRIHPLPAALVGLLAALLAACATPQTERPEISRLALSLEEREQQAFVIAQRRAEHARVLGVHRRLSAANLEFCSLTAASIGAAVETSASYPKEFEAAARAAGIGARPVIAVVLDGSPAADAGVRVGDVVMAVDGRRIAANPMGMQKLRHYISSGVGRMDLAIMRADGPHTIGVMRETICGYPVHVVNDQDLNAHADGASVLLPRGMLRFAGSDENLALIIAHEMAHNAMGHLRARSRNEIAGMIGGALVDGAVLVATGIQSDAFSRVGARMAASAYSRAFESEADYVGLYFVARAGYDISGVEMFWRRVAAEFPDDVAFAATHPTSAERFVGLAATRAEIRARQAEGVALRPNMKSGRSARSRMEPGTAPPR